MNKATVYSNGITAFVKQYSIGDKTTIEIPVKKSNIHDILSSLVVLGDVTQNACNFSPTNANQTSLEINYQQLVDSLIDQLSGSAIEATVSGKCIVGTLIGRQDYEQNNGSFKTKSSLIGISTTSGIRFVPSSELNDLKFTEPEVQKEIEKALRAKRQSIKEDSTFINVELSSNVKGNTTATLLYAVPTAAWNVNYRLTKEKDKYSLQGWAVVHNNTDEDWSNMTISVVTGEPTTFESDIAEQKIPKRKQVSFVKENSEGSATLENGFETEAMTFAAAVPMGIGTPHCAKSSVRSISADGAARATVSTADTMEIGDFSIWSTTNPINVEAQKSALIPLFDKELATADLMLYYNSDMNLTRPYRTIKFTNNTGKSLGYGPCTIYNNGVNEGECEFSSCKDGEKRTLVFAKETGVLVQMNTDGISQRRIKVVVEDGIATTDVLETSKTIYSVKNSKNEDFDLEIDYKKKILNSKVKSKERVSEVLSNGVRLTTKLNPMAQMTIEVEEEKVTPTKQTIGFQWIKANLLDIDNPPKGIGLDEIVKAKEKENEFNKQITQAKERITLLEKEQERARKNKSVVMDQENSVEITRSIMDSEKEIKKLTNQLPELEAAAQIAAKNVSDAIKKLRTTIA
jgi:hypothetical protein